MPADFSIVTEQGGELVSSAQLLRFYQRYIWAGQLCAKKDVLELACGTGPGLGYLHSITHSLVAGDICDSVLTLARQHYGNRIDLRQFDAACTPFDDASFDVIILFEAIYYISDINALLSEVKRLLRPNGKFLLATANKDLSDFNPSPFSHHYFNPPELTALLHQYNFSVKFFGGSLVVSAGIVARLLRFLKKVAVKFHLIPNSMRGKRLLKRLVFGRLVQMPIELNIDAAFYEAPEAIDSHVPNTTHQVIYCIAEKC